MKLPKLSLATFNGDPTNWTRCWDSFKSTIGDHRGLSKIDKLKYLVNSLTGVAAQTLTGLQISNDSYDEAIELLEKRFGNKQVIITSFMDSLRELPKQGRTLKFHLGGCQHALDRLNFSGPTERIWAVRTHWEL